LEIAKVVENVAFEILKQAVIYLPNDVKKALKKAYEEETSETGKTQLKAILDNIELAEKFQAPVCQDTGTIIFYAKAGAKVKNLDKVEEALVNATRRATKEIPLRPNAVDPFTQKNSGDNTGRFIPYINWEIVPGDNLELTAMTKGGGSENVCVTGMLVPGEGVKGVKEVCCGRRDKGWSTTMPTHNFGRCRRRRSRHSYEVGEESVA